MAGLAAGPVPVANDPKATSVATTVTPRRLLGSSALSLSSQLEQVRPRRSKLLWIAREEKESISVRHRDLG
jgi:hypothetical protein